MAFGIGSFFKNLIPQIAAPIGFALGGPIGGVIGGAVGQAFAPSRQTIFGPSLVGPSVGPSAAFDVTRRRVGTVGSIVGGALLATVVDLLRTSRQRTGQPVSVAKVIEAVRVCGIEQAAVIFDLSENEICRVVISKRRRRARGISAVDLRRTRSTIRKVHNIAHDLKALAPPVRRHHR